MTEWRGSKRVGKGEVLDTHRSERERQLTKEVRGPRGQCRRGSAEGKAERDTSLWL